MSFKVVNLESLNKKYNLNVSGICHVGAHTAKESHRYINLFGNIPILFLEANPQQEEYIKNNIKDYKSIDYKIVAAGETFSTSKFYLNTSTEGQSSSLLKPLEHLKLYPFATFNKTIEVNVEPLDFILGYFSPNFLNIDVQGYELNVLKGANEKLKKVKYIIVEVNKTELYEGCAMVDEIDEYLKKNNFERVELEWYGNTEPWGDAFYINKSML